MDAQPVQARTYRPQDQISVGPSKARGRGRLARFASVSSVAMLVGVLLIPVPAAAQPARPEGLPADGAPAANDCGQSDVTGDAPSGSFTISGTVTNGVGAGIADVRVRASGGSAGLAQTTTNAVGAYVLSELEAAPYRLSFYDESASYQSGFLAPTGFVFDKAAALPIDVSGDLTGIDIVLPDERLLTISGQITDHVGAGVPDVEMHAQSPDFPMGGCGTSASDGTFVMPDVRVGQYRVSLSDPSGIHPYGYYAAAAPHFTTRIADAATLSVGADLPGTDISYPATFSLSGLIRNESLVGVESISLVACEVPEGGRCASSTSLAGGSFTIDTLVAGSYVIHQSDGSLTYQSGYHVPGGTVPDAAGATLIPVSGDVTGVQLTAILNPRISGLVTDALGAPLDGIDVSACLLSDEYDCASTVSDAGGGYAMGVNPGSYEIRFSDPTGTRPSGYYGPADTGQPVSLVADRADARLVTVGAADVSGISIAIPDGGRVSGTVLSGGQPAPYIGVNVCPTDSYCHVDTASDDTGAFETPAVFVGVYRVGAYTDDGTRVWYVDGGPASTDFAAATPVTIGATGVGGIVIVLPATEPPAQTPVGTDVGVVPVDPGSGGTPISLTFDNVTVAGETSLTVSGSGPPAPAGFQLGLPPTYYDISTTASFGGLVTICISYAGVSFSDEATLRLFHYDSTAGSWQDRTTSHDLDNDVICGRTDSFSPFALFQRNFAFTEFFAPIDDLPTVNRLNAGKAVSIKFGVGGDFGLDIFAAGTPTSQRVVCSTGQADGDPKATTAAGKSRLVFAAGTGRYEYIWKTEKAWAKTCRMLTLTFRDGTTARAAFKFK